MDLPKLTGKVESIFYVASIVVLCLYKMYAYSEEVLYMFFQIKLKETDLYYMYL